MTTEFGDGCMNLRTLFLKTDKFSAFSRPESNSFHSKMADEKNIILKKLWLVLRRRILSVFLVECNIRLTGIKLKIY